MAAAATEAGSAGAATAEEGWAEAAMAEAATEKGWAEAAMAAAATAETGWAEEATTVATATTAAAQRPAAASRRAGWRGGGGDQRHWVQRVFRKRATSAANWQPALVQYSRSRARAAMRFSSSVALSNSVLLSTAVAGKFTHSLAR